jgi:synaptobrevin family protein YKT6
VLLASEIDVNMLWFYQRAMAKEHINFNSRLIAGRTQPGSKCTITLEQDIGNCHCWTTADGISATAITDMEYPERAAFILLNNLLLDFREYFAADPSVY